jgi:BirA family transcriptional regulator, biotin operon repressor / biotin---[acetyl-CoA-carboxylase] ligase
MTDIPYFDYVEHHPRINSTNARAMTLVRSHDVQGHFLIVADEQFAGRGRTGKSWLSPKGGLWFTAGFQNLPEAANLTLYLGVCLRRAVAAMIPDPERLRLKWPNDLMLGERKLAGILVERPFPSQYHVAGIGVDTNLAELPGEPDATSLKLDYGRDFDNQALLTAIFEAFFNGLPGFVEHGLAEVLDEYRTHDFLNGRDVVLSTEFSEYPGTACGIGRDGALLVRMNGMMIQPFHSGSVVSYGPAGEIS